MVRFQESTQNPEKLARMPDSAEPSFSAVDQACQTIAAQVASGRWPGGFTLIEADLIDHLQVARSTVREALRRLESQGLVVRGRSRNLVVRRLSRRDVTELYELREVLESHAAARAAGQFDSLPAAVKREWKARALWWKKAGVAGRVEALSEANRAFHDDIHALSGNSHLPRLLDGTLMTLFMSQFRPWMTAQSTAAASTQHVAICEAIMGTDAARASTRMREHILSSAQTVLALGDDAFGR